MFSTPSSSYPNMRKAPLGFGEVANVSRCVLFGKNLKKKLVANV